MVGLRWRPEPGAGGLGLQLQGTSYEGRYVIVDIELESDRPTERLA